MGGSLSKCFSPSHGKGGDGETHRHRSSRQNGEPRPHRHHRRRRRRARATSTEGAAAIPERSPSALSDEYFDAEGSDGSGSTYLSGEDRMFSAREEVSDWSDADEHASEQPQTLLGKISSIFSARSALAELAALSPRTSPRGGREIPPLRVLSGMSGVSQRVPFPVLARPACKWGDADVANFDVRGKNYMRDKRKVPAPQPLYQLLGADLFSFERKIPHVAEHIALPPPPRLGPRASLSPLAPLLIVNFQLPDYAPSMIGGASDGPGRFLVLYFALPEGWEPPEDGRTKVWTPTALGLHSTRSSSRGASRPPMPPSSDGRRGRRRGLGAPAPGSGTVLPATPEVPATAEQHSPGAAAAAAAPRATPEGSSDRSTVLLRLSTDEAYQSPFDTVAAAKASVALAGGADAAARPPPIPNGGVAANGDADGACKASGGAAAAPAGGSPPPPSASSGGAPPLPAGTSNGGAPPLPAGTSNGDASPPPALNSPFGGTPGSPPATPPRAATAESLSAAPARTATGGSASSAHAGASPAKSASAAASTVGATEVGSCEPTPRPPTRAPTAASEAASAACSTAPAHATGAGAASPAPQVASVRVVRAEATPSLAITERLFSNGTEHDGKPTRDRLKLIPHVNDVAGWAKRAPLSRTEHNLLLRYNNKPVLTRPQHAFYRGKNYVEIDLDVHSYAYLARRALHGFRSRIHTIDVDLALVVQGNAPDELPEGLLCAARIHDLDWNGAQGFVKVGDAGADGRSGHVASAQPRPS